MWTTTAIMTDGKRKWEMCIWDQYESALDAKAAADKIVQLYGQMVREIEIFPTNWDKGVNKQ